MQIEPISFKEMEPNRFSDITFEREIWKTYAIDKLLNKPDKCPLCTYPNINITEYNTLNNSYIARCSNCKCRKIIYLREGINHFPRTTVSNILYIIKLWLFDNKNASDIYNKFKNECPNINISLLHISEILQKLREYIAHYIKDIYSIEDISQENRMERFAMDESNFVTDGNITTWVVGIINVTSRKIRLEYPENRNTNTIKKIVHAHIKKGNIVVSDAWGGYSWLSNADSGYIHSTHTHSLGNFGRGDESTSHIEQLWHHLKLIIKKIYNMIQKKHFIYFLRESEFRRNLSFLSYEGKWESIYDTLNYIKNLNLNNLYSLEELIQITERI